MLRVMVSLLLIVSAGAVSAAAAQQPQQMREGLFDEITLWDNNVARGADAIRIATSSHRSGHIEIWERELWENFLKKSPSYTPTATTGAAKIQSDELRERFEKLFRELDDVGITSGGDLFPTVATDDAGLAAKARAEKAWGKIMDHVEALDDDDVEAFKRVGNLIDAWANSSDNVGARELQWAANQLFGNELGVYADAHWWAGAPGPAAEKLAGAMADHYAVTQAALKQAFPSGKITVYRGILGPQAEEVKRLLAAGQNTMHVDTSAISSWTLDLEVASQAAFARNGVVLVQEIDITDVVTLPGLKHFSLRSPKGRARDDLIEFILDGQRWEKEIMVYGNRHTTQVISVLGGE